MLPQVHRLARPQQGAQGLHHPHQGAGHHDQLDIMFAFKTRKTEMVVKYDREREGVITFPRETHKVVFLESYDHHPEPHVVNKKSDF